MVSVDLRSAVHIVSQVQGAIQDALPCTPPLHKFTLHPRTYGWARRIYSRAIDRATEELLMSQLRHLSLAAR